MRTTERIRLTSIFDPSRTEEIEAIVDSGATLLVIPEDVVQRLALRRMREVPVRYTSGEVARRAIYAAATVEVSGRSGTFDVLAGPLGTDALLGHIVMEVPDLVVEPTTGSLRPNPRSPDAPMVDVLSMRR